MKKAIVILMFPLLVFSKEITIIQAGKSFLPSIPKEKLNKAKNSRGKYKKTKISKMEIKKITIDKGDTITFINNDTVVHNVFGKGFSFNQTVGSKHSKKFEKVGERTVRCAIHPKMKLKIKVKEEEQKDIP